MPRVAVGLARPLASILVLALTVALPRRAPAVEWLPDGVPIESHVGSVTELVSLPDGAGGSFVVWVQGAGDSIHAQRVDAGGNRLWGVNGIPVCGATGQQTAVRMAADGAGGFVVAWTDTRSDPGDIYVQRITAGGTTLWTTDGVALTGAGTQNGPDITGDGAGGAVATWVVSTDIAVRAISASGTPLGPANGVTICAATGTQSVPRIASDGAGGAIVTWQDARSTTPDVFAARFTSAGTVPWTPDGVIVLGGAGNQTAPEIVADGAGGAIVVLLTSAPFTTTPTYCGALRLNSSGTHVWSSGGVQVVSGPAIGPRSLVDGAGGVFVQGLAPNAFAQHLDSNGNPLWTADGVPTGIGTPTGMALDASGVLLVCGKDGAGAIRGQAISAAGAPLWGSAGLAIGTATGDRAQIAPDGAGGALLVWDDAGADDVYGMRVLAGAELPFLRPSLTDVVDLPADEGGFVRLLVDMNTADSYPTAPEETGFTVWRRIAPPAEALPVTAEVGDVAAALERARTLPTRLTPELAAAAAFPPGTWETLGFHASLQLRNYTVAVPTRTDSTASGSADETFVVVTHTTTPTVWYASLPDSGHSVDNLAPGAPQSVAGVFEPASTLHLTWDPNPEGDLHRYAVYRGVSAGFAPGPSNRLGYADAAAFDDPAFVPGSYYKVSAIDRHGNESPFALFSSQQVAEVPGGEVPAMAFLAPPAPNPAHVSCVFGFGLSREGPVRLELFDIAGRKVRDLRNGEESAGVHRVEWDLRDAGGHRVAPGLYWAHLRTEGRSIARRVTVSR